MNDYIEFNYIEIEQPIGKFYIGSIEWEDLTSIAAADIRRIEKEEGGGKHVENYLGIQRERSGKRIKEISEYVKTVDATFPTSIILSIDSRLSEEEKDDVINIKFNKDKTKLLIRKDENVAKIIDGQHRMEGLKLGFENMEEKARPRFQFNVTIFVDMDIEEQALVFSTINKAQTKVIKSLTYDLFAYAKSRSPQKTCHNIVRLLNDQSESPFYNKIKMLGKAFDKDLETITQATLVESIINYISREPMKDRDVLKRGKKLALETDKKILERYFLRNLFIEEKDTIIARIILNYFNAVKNKWPNSWEENKFDNILNKSTGVVALMKFFKDAYLHFNKIGEVITQKEFEEVFKEIKIKPDEFTKDNYLPGGIGQSKLYKDLFEQSKINNLK